MQPHFAIPAIVLCGLLGGSHICGGVSYNRVALPVHHPVLQWLIPGRDELRCIGINMNPSELVNYPLYWAIHLQAGHRLTPQTHTYLVYMQLRGRECLGHRWIAQFKWRLPHTLLSPPINRSLSRFSDHLVLYMCFGGNYLKSFYGQKWSFPEANQQ